MNATAQHFGVFILALLVLLGLAACAEEDQNPNTALSVGSQSLQVFKRSSCACCSKGVKHIQAAGVSATATNTQALNTIKSQYGIAPRYQSCHTAISSEEGYVFEGHIPAHMIERFLLEKPQNALGLAVPGIPAGSPGMEVGNRFDAYDVLLLRKDGSAEVYAQFAGPGIEILGDLPKGNSL